MGKNQKIWDTGQTSENGNTRCKVKVDEKIFQTFEVNTGSG